MRVIHTYSHLMPDEIGIAQAAVDSPDGLGGRACKEAGYDVARQSGFVMI